ncbi:unnamed protein product [Polarella glacialis]|uniref:Flavoprotein domain-containing protein n=1 Tax=Polarella glacialis TaxID=89957 RepID=A0A813KQA8_POLGL|nr:unnamed protein product [Polarella glacialis]
MGLALRSPQQGAGKSTYELVALAVAAGIAGGFLGTLAAWHWLLPKTGLPKAEEPSSSGRGDGGRRSRAWLREPPGERPRVVLVATGSVASVKVPEMAAALCEFAELVVILTSAGEVMAGKDVAGRYAPGTFDAWERLLAESESNASKNENRRICRVLRDSDEWDGYQDVSSDAVVHVELRKWADIAVVAPCSANTLAKVALGLCDNLATCFLRAWDPERPLLLAPAMNTVMWEHPSTADHLRTLEDRGCKIVPPASKRLACGDVGRGALAPVSEVVNEVRQACEGYQARRAAAGSGLGAWQRRGFAEWRSPP